MSDTRKKQIAIGVAKTWYCHRHSDKNFSASLYAL